MNRNSCDQFSPNATIFENHPNPSWARRSFISLDGTWKIEHNGHSAQIRVPFPVGSELSGVDFKDSGTFIYQRTFEIDDLRDDECLLLNIGACDYATTVSVNSITIGKHVGGYSSFAFDITEAVHRGTNCIELLVRDSHSPFQVRGKQTFLGKPFYVWYKGISGVWQSIWIEMVHRAHLAHAELTPDFSESIVRGKTGMVFQRRTSKTMGKADSVTENLARFSLHVEITTPENTKIVLPPALPDQEGSFEFRCSFNEIAAKFWSTEYPFLYGIKYYLYEENDCIDIVESYFGLRNVAVNDDGFIINGEKTFLRMVLVQGYYPGGQYTPRHREIMENDIRTIKSFDYNGVRIHEKVENPYFQYLCDKIGLFTSFEMPSFYLPSRAAFSEYEQELKELLKRDSGHPSCIFRILFNETWGIWGIYGKRTKTRKFVLSMIDVVRKMDPSRPIIDNSGWEHIDTDVVDFHHYLSSAMLARQKYAEIAQGNQNAFFNFSIGRVLAFYAFGQVSSKTRSIFLGSPHSQAGKVNIAPKSRIFLSEYGGFGWYAAEKRGSIADNIEEYTRDIVASKVFCGYCYTQLYDVGNETNGLLTFGRELKIDIHRMQAINS